MNINNINSRVVHTYKNQTITTPKHSQKQIAGTETEISTKDSFVSSAKSNEIDSWNSQSVLLSKIKNNMNSVKKSVESQFIDTIKSAKNKIKNIFTKAKKALFEKKEIKNNPGSLDDVKDKHTQEQLAKVPDYVNALDARHSATDPTVKAVYDKYEPKIKIKDVDNQGTAYYSAKEKAVHLNATEDMKNRPIPGSTYYHEVGHLIDDAMTKDSLVNTITGSGKFASVKNKKFTEALHNDFENYVSNYMKEKDLSREDAYAAIAKEMSGKNADNYRGVSDIYGAISGGKAQGSWGHSKEYWDSDKAHLPKESFANMFDASMSNPEAAKHMKEMLPTAYAEFQNMLANELK